MTREIETQTYVVSSSIMHIAEEDDPKIVEHQWIELGKKMEECLEKNDLVLVRKPKTYDDPYHVDSWCSKEDCEFKKRDFYDLEDCMENHPSYIESSPPYHLIGISFRVIPKKYEAYKEFFKEANIVVIRE